MIELARPTCCLNLGSGSYTHSEVSLGSVHRLVILQPCNGWVWNTIGYALQGDWLVSYHSPLGKVGGLDCWRNWIKRRERQNETTIKEGSD